VVAIERERGAKGLGGCDPFRPGDRALGIREQAPYFGLPRGGAEMRIGPLVTELLLQGLDEPVRVVVEVLVVDAKRLPIPEGRNLRHEVLVRGKSGSADEERDDLELQP
jgi:hypothetical protein